MASDTGRKIRTTKSVRWANPFLKAFGKTPPAVPTTRRVPDGTRVYCVGDIHGRDDLLREMAERVEADMEARSFDHAVTVFLGDYVDRGLGSKRVVERLARGEWPTPMIALAGNHEDLLIAFLEDEAAPRSLARPRRARNPAFLRCGCRAGHGWTRFQSSSSGIRDRFPERHRHFLKTLKVSTHHRRLLLLSCRSKAGRASRSPRSR